HVSVKDEVHTIVGDLSIYTHPGEPEHGDIQRYSEVRRGNGAHSNHRSPILRFASDAQNIFAQDDRVHLSLAGDATAKGNHCGCTSCPTEAKAKAKAFDEGGCPLKANWPSSAMTKLGGSNWVLRAMPISLRITPRKPIGAIRIPRGATASRAKVSAFSETIKA